MVNPFEQFLDRIGVLLIRGYEVARVDGIVLADCRNRDRGFQDTIAHALQLIRDHDKRRYARVKRHIHFIVNFVPMAGNAYFDNGTCTIDFQTFPSASESEVLDLAAALYAGVLIHEATHGAIAARGIRYRGSKRSRIERLCVTEQNRFAARLSELDSVRFPLELLQQEFHPTNWESYWKEGPLRRTLRFLRRCKADENAEPCMRP